jgi:Niemann-Pick C1 protein
MRGLGLIPVIASLGSFLIPQSLAQGETKIHEKGRCAIRGHCGKKSFFGGDLPCPDNGVAEEPETAVRNKLVGLCGSKWKDGLVCCKDEQVSSIQMWQGPSKPPDQLTCCDCILIRFVARSMLSQGT